MKFKDLLAITGKPGLYEMITPRGDGLVVRGLGEQKKFFVSSRRNMFNPLDNIGIYLISGDTVELRKVMQAVHADADRPSPKASANELKEWFATIVEDYDEDQVYVSDMKKILKWYATIEEHKLTGLLEENEATDEEE